MRDEATFRGKSDLAETLRCGATCDGEGLSRIGEGAAMIGSRREAGPGDSGQAVRHMRMDRAEIRGRSTLGEAGLAGSAKQLGAPLEFVREVARSSRLPVVL